MFYNLHTPKKIITLNNYNFYLNGETKAMLSVIE